MLPRDIEAERTVIGACLANPKVCIPSVSVVISPDDFFDEFNRHAYTTMLDMASQGEQIQWLAVANRMTRTIPDVSTLVPSVSTEINNLQTFVGDEGVACDAADYVLKASQKRRLIGLLHRFSVAAYDPTADPNDLASDATEALIALSVNRVRSLSADTRQILAGTADRPGLAGEIMDFLEDPTRIRGIRTGWEMFDQWLSGLERTKLYTIIADTSVGKSIISHWLMWMLSQQGYRSLVVSTEMDRNEILRRIAGMEAQVDFQAITKRAVASGPERKRLNQAIETLNTQNRIVVCDVGQIRLDVLVAEVTRLRRMSQIDAVFIDHIQHVQVKGIPSNQQTARLEVVTATLKALAMNEDVPIVQVSHINRESAKAGFAGVHGGKGSGSIEQDSNVQIELTAVKWDKTTRSFEPFVDELEATTYQASHNRQPIRVQVNKNRSGGRPWDVLIRDWERGGRFCPPEQEDLA